MTFASSGLRIDLQETSTIASAIQALLAQAEVQERIHTRYVYRESVLRYLTGAQLEINLGHSTPALPHKLLTHWAWDEDCSAQYETGNTMYVVTGTPGDPLLATLRHLVMLGWKPIVISRGDKIEAANDMLDASGLLRSVSAMSLEMLIYASLRRQRKDASTSLMGAMNDLFVVYNQIVSQVGAAATLLIESPFSNTGNRVDTVEHRQPYAAA